MVRMGRRAFLKTSPVAVGGLMGVALFSNDTSANTTATWGSFQYDEGNTGYAPSGTAPTEGLTHVETYEITNGVAGSPAIDDGKLFVAANGPYNNAPKLRAFDISDSSVVWSEDSFSAPRTDSPVVVHNGTVYASDQGINHLHAFDADTGDVQWLKEIGSGSVSYESTNDVVFCAGYGLDPEGGTNRWRTSGTPWESMAHASQDGSIYFVNADNAHLVAISSADGSERWRATANHTGSPTATANAVYVPINYERVRAYDPVSGSELWTSPDLPTDDLATSVAAADDTVYVTYGSVTALDSSDGSIRWQVEPNPPPYSSPIVIDDVLYAPAAGQSLNPTILALDTSDGSELAQVSVPDKGDVIAAATGSLYTGAGSIHEVTGEGGGEVSLTLVLPDETAESGGTVSITFIMTNNGSARSTGLQGFITPPSDEWAVTGEPGSFNTLGAGETDRATVTHEVPADAEGTYEFAGVVEDDGGNRASDTATVTVQSGTELELTVTGGTTHPGGTVTVTYQLINSGNTTVAGDSTLVAPASGEQPPGVTVNEGPVEDGGAIDGKAWYDWAIEPGGELSAELELELPTDIAVGEYHFTVETEEDPSSDRVLDTDSGTVTVEQTPFRSWKEAHLETATHLDELAVSDFGAADRARRANDAYTTAVNDGRLSRTDAIEAIRRLDNGLGITENVFEYTTSAPEISSDEVDLIGEMARPALNTALELATTAISIGKKISKGVGLGSKKILKVAKSKALDSMKSLLMTVFGDVVDAASEVRTKGDTLVSKLIKGSFETVDQMLEFKDQLLDDLVAAVSTSLQYAVEQSLVMSPVVSQLYPDGTGVSLSDGLAVFYTKLSANTVADSGLDGSMTGASTAASEATSSIRGEAEGTQALIADAKAFNEEFSLSSAVYDLFQTPDAGDVIQTLVSAVLFVAGGIVDAFSTGGGYGALVKINVTHHLGLWNVQEGGVS